MQLANSSFPRMLLMIALASLSLYGSSSCADDHSHNEPTDDAIYEGATNDEALVALEGASPKTDSVSGPSFSTPGNGQKLASATPSTFSWKTSAAHLDLRHPKSAPTLLPWGPIRSAHAHGTPVNGRVYLLRFSAVGNDKLLRVFTSNLEYLPSAEAWTKLKSAGGPITATITTALFDSNRLVQGQSPVVGAGTTFTIEP